MQAVKSKRPKSDTARCGATKRIRIRGEDFPCKCSRLIGHGGPHIDKNFALAWAETGKWRPLQLAD